MRVEGMSEEEISPRERRRCRPPVVVLLAMALCLGGAVACDQGGADGGTTTSAHDNGAPSGDIEGGIGVPIVVGDAVLTVRSLQDAFQPVSPVQKLSDATPVAPAAGEGFYQAYVRVENRGDLPLRVDAEHFACLIGNAVSNIEPTRSGPAARSLIGGTSLDLVLTFKGQAGNDPVLIYSPPWYDGVITVSAAVQTGVTTTTVPAGQ
jgi:hypothetical protein